MPRTMQKGRRKCPVPCRREEGKAAIKVGYKSRPGARGGDIQDGAEGKKERRL